MRKFLASLIATTLVLCACDKVHRPENTPENSNVQQEQTGLILRNAYIPYRSDQQQHFAAYFDLVNRSDAPLKIINAYSPAFASVMLHETVFEDCMAKMKHIENIPLAPDESVSFKPKGKHVMLMQPQRELSRMSGVFLILELDNSQKLKYEIDFQKK